MDERTAEQLAAIVGGEDRERGHYPFEHRRRRGGLHEREHQRQREGEGRVLADPRRRGRHLAVGRAQDEDRGGHAAVAEELFVLEGELRLDDEGLVARGYAYHPAGAGRPRRYLSMVGAKVICWFDG